MAEPALDIDIRIDADGWRDVSFPAEAAVREAALAAVRACAQGDALELSVLLTGDDAIAELNHRWRGKEGPTNVLSFPGDRAASGGMPVLLGDVVIALETVRNEARQGNVPEADHVKHLAIHGVLHLLGYDHETDEDAAEMERCEIEILASLGVADPYAASAGPLEGAVR